MVLCSCVLRYPPLFHFSLVKLYDYPPCTTLLHPILTPSLPIPPSPWVFLDACQSQNRAVLCAVDTLVNQTDTGLSTTEHDCPHTAGPVCGSHHFLTFYSPCFSLAPFLPPLPHSRSPFALSKINGPWTSLNFITSLDEDPNWFLFVSQNRYNLWDCGLHDCRTCSGIIHSAQQTIWLIVGA